ncbi:MAG TPA: HAD family hydrolase, partial [bacterium]
MNFDSTKVIFFDLDNTLFDHTRAERNALFSLIKENAEVFAGVEPEMFVRVYREVNKVLWKKMAAGEVSGEELKGLRFQMSLSEFDRDDGDAELLSKQYFEFYSRQSCALPNAHETLAYLRPNYELGILSNGFPEIQERKLRNLQMAAHFKFKIYSG